MAKLRRLGSFSIKGGKTQPNVGWVYLAYSPRLRLHKIGMTTSLHHRLPQLQRKFKDPRIKYVTSIKTPKYEELERALHLLFASKYVGKEFFNLSAEDVQSLLKFAESYR